jgi:glutathione S-transferase
MAKSGIILYGTTLSGHTHRVELLLRALGLDFDFVPAPAEVRRSEAFRKLNPLGQVPVLQDGELVLADSNAILVYLAKRYAPDSDWIPQDPVEAAQMQRWFSIAAGEIMHGPAVARLIVQFKFEDDPARAEAIAARLLGFMDTYLQERSYLVGARCTLADLACYSYVAHAPEGGIPLDAYPAVRAWLARIEALPFFKPIPPSPIPARAA